MLLLLLIWLVLGLLYVGAVAMWVFSLASRGRIGAAVGVVSAGLGVRMVAGGFRVYPSEALSWWYLPFFAGVAWGLVQATRLPRSPIGGAGGELLPAPLRGLPRSPLRGRKLLVHNVLQLVKFALPITMVLNYCGTYLQRVASGAPTYYLKLNSSWDYANHFEGAPLVVGIILFGCLLYERLLQQLPPARSRAYDDRRALLLLPLMLAPWFAFGVTRAFPYHGIALVQGLAVYFFVFRRFADPTVGPTEAVYARDPSFVAYSSRRSQADVRRRRRYALTGGALGALVGIFAITAAGVENADALAVAAEQMFFITLPMSIPLRAVVDTFGVGAADFRWELTTRLIPFLLAAPVANGLLLGWLVARGLEARSFLKARKPARRRAS